VPGVSAVTVNLATEEASLECGDVNTETLASALEARGYHLVVPKPGLGPAPEMHGALLRVIVAWILTAPLMMAMVPGLHLHLPWELQALFSAGAAFGAGWPFLARASRQALRGETSMDTLIALGATVSWGFGFHEGLRGAMHPTFETAAALVAFLLVGKFLEAKAKHRATDALEVLLRLAPARAFRIQSNGSETEVPVAELHAGDRVRVKPGGAIPVDGVVLAGSADVEEALLTGEPMPVPKAAGDRVIALHHIPCGECFYCRRKLYAQCPVYKRVGVTAGFEPAGGGFAQYVRVMDWIAERGVERIPAGVSTGSKVRVPGKGRTEEGDLYVALTVEPHPYFGREGDDILAEVPLTVPEAYLGADIDVPTIHGPVRAKIPPGTAAGQRFRLKGFGVRSGRGADGDHYYRVTIAMPEHITPEGRDLAGKFSTLYGRDPRASLPSGL